MADVAFPYGFDTRGRTAEPTADDHVRDLVEQVLFTSPGERVNRPTFGSGLLRVVFGPNSAEVAAATRFLVQGALQQTLGDLIEVANVEVAADESVLRVTVAYAVRQTQEQVVASFTRGGAP
ncbi:MAG TPA: GPW/gp25 family protein [Myxococcales bacterium]